MLLWVILAWILAVPVLVVAGLWGSAALLGRRARRHGGVDVSPFAREIERLSAREPLLVEREPLPVAGTQPSAVPTETSERRHSVGAGA